MGRILGQKRFSLAERLGERGNLAIRKAQRRFKAAPDFMPELRNAARAISMMRHKGTSERKKLRRFIKSLGVDPNKISARVIESLADSILSEVDRQQAIETYGVPWRVAKSSGSIAPAPPSPLFNLDGKIDEETIPTKEAIEKYKLECKTPKRVQPGLNTRRLSEVQATEVDWIDYGFLAKGKLTLVSGPPGVGKTWVALDSASRITSQERRDVLWISAEDADDDTIKPRIELLGGDPSRIHSLQFNYDVENDKERLLALDHQLGDLETWLRSHPLVDLIVFDPISAYLGKTDTHKDAAVRAVLSPVAKLAEKYSVSILCINHFSKANEGPAVNRGIGSIAFVAAARLTWQVIADTETPGRSLLLPVKVNIARNVMGRAFSLGERGLMWEEGSIQVTADEVLNGPSASKRDAAKDWLRDLLKAGAMPADEVFRQAAESKIASVSTIKTAKRELGVVAERVGGTHGEWRWSLPAS